MGMRFMRRPASLWDGEPAEVVTGPRRFPMKKTWSRSPSAAGRDPGCGPGISLSTTPPGLIRIQKEIPVFR